ncbi:UNVERIFIED_CONTAM: Photosystem II repair protein PSB27-H1, chloroplastic [Sesamum latifolium]|uniref:Photosystem II repair protein PSB27-H1, chloroplastic n=1 Tax=Sesamum latifolium TaxID=2727402 RepID=A0AAW2U0U3_9LAMI
MISQRGNSPNHIFHFPHKIYDTLSLHTSTHPPTPPPMASPTLITPTPPPPPPNPSYPSDQKSLSPPPPPPPPLHPHPHSSHAAVILSPSSDEEYVKETEEVINKVRTTITLDKNDPNVANAVAELRETSNSWVAKYRREKALLGRASFRDMYSASTLFPATTSALGRRLRSRRRESKESWKRWTLPRKLY